MTDDALAEALVSPTVHFSHAAYRLAERFALRGSGVSHFQTWDRESLFERIGDSEILVLSGFWDNALIPRAKRLRYIQACAVGYDQFDQDALRAAGIRLSNTPGLNANAVSEHAIALLLAFTRQIHVARDNQRAHRWRGMISELDAREDELPGKTLAVVGLGTIGGRVARLARALGMRTIGFKRNLSTGGEDVDEIYPPSELPEHLPRADAVVLCCPLTEETRGLLGERELGLMRRGAFLVNVARGPCVDTGALLRALEDGHLAGAGLDVTDPEPLPQDSPLWERDDVILTPHTGGETRRYEDNVIDTLLENLGRLASSRPLLNAVV